MVECFFENYHEYYSNNEDDCSDLLTFRAKG